MKNDTDFLDQLRVEITEEKKKRTDFVKAKITFIVSLLGIGSISFNESLQTKFLFYILPLIGFFFDLYIWGENFGIKRAGRFIKKSPEVSSEEKIWETSIQLHRDRYSYIAGVVSSILILFAATMGIIISDVKIFPLPAWICFNSIFRIILTNYINGIECCEVCK